MGERVVAIYESPFGTFSIIAGVEFRSKVGQRKFAQCSAPTVALPDAEAEEEAERGRVCT